MAIMTLTVSLLRLWHSRNREVVLIGMALLIFAFSVSSVEGKRRRTVFHPPLKIIEVIPNPSPLEIGSGELELSIVVELPVNHREANVLEVTSVITSASKRSVRFLI